MSTPWIKVRTNLFNDPRVVCIAETLGLDRYAVIGRLVAFWAWADEYTVDGNGLIVTSAFIDQQFTCMGLATALRKVGWLRGEEGNLSIPNFTEHNGQSARSRSLTADRVKAHKQKRSGNDAIVTSSVSVSLLNSPEGEVQERKPKQAPAIEEWLAYAKENHPDWPKPDAESAWRHYESQGWKRGRTPIVKWRACVATCFANWKVRGSSGQSGLRLEDEQDRRDRAGYRL